MSPNQAVADAVFGEALLACCSFGQAFTFKFTKSLVIKERKIVVACYSRVGNNYPPEFWAELTKPFPLTVQHNQKRLERRTETVRKLSENVTL